MNILRTLSAALCLAVLVLFSLPARAEQPGGLPEASQKVLVEVDAAGSYKSRQAEALERASALLEAMAARNTRRFDSGKEVISIVALDAMPEVIWQGTRKALKADRSSWHDKFRSRGQLAACTDVTAGFRLAAQLLEGDPRYTAKYVVAFTDMIHEPPLGSLSACAKARPEPGPDFPWQELRGASITILWAPGSQKLVWTRAAKANGMEEILKIYTEGESALADLPDPRLPEVQLTEAERLARQNEMREMLKTGGRLFGWGAATVVASALCLGLLAVLVRWWRSRRPPATSVGRPQA
ncbi:MAG: hypothetical protein Q7I92_13850 [Humidesulfovibrio sp.]|nr:hypothetical protein [Humidesulfovibrio sp.]